MDILWLTGWALRSFFFTFLLGLVTIALVFWNSHRKQSYWKKVGIPYIKPLEYYGSLLQFMKKPLPDIDVDRFNKYGRIYGYYEANETVLSVSEPRIIRSILVKDFLNFTGKRNFEFGNEIMDRSLSVIRGEDWKRIRSIVSPTFTTGKIKRMMSIFKDCSRTLMKNFKQVSEKGESVDAKSLYGAFTMDVIASSAFSTKIDSHNDPNNQFVSAAKSFFMKEINWKFLILFVLAPKLLKLFNITFFSQKSLMFFREVTLQIVEERKRTGQRRNDFLQLLMDTAKEVKEEGRYDSNENDDITENYGNVESDDVLKDYLNKKNLSHNELVAQCCMFFFAGYDTTATTLSLVSYLLALNPDIQETLIQELDDALRANDGELTYEAVQSLKYLDNVIAETLRLYPPLIRTERLASEDYKLEETGLLIPKGTVIAIPIYAMHRDPSLFPNPEKFDPDRFTPEERAKRDPYSYLPFSAGPRNCVGMRFVLMEMKVCLAYVLSNFRIRRCPATKVPLEIHNSPGILQPKTISLFMDRRTDTPAAL